MSLRCHGRSGVFRAGLALLGLTMGLRVLAADEVSSRIGAAVDRVPARVAILPVDNATGAGLSLQRVDEALAGALSEAGFDVVPAGDVGAFLARRRIRYTGGIDLEALTAARAELGANAVAVGTVDLWTEEPPPRFALSARLVRTSDGVILWADEIAAAGEDRPGVLGLGEVSDVAHLVASVTERLMSALRELVDPGIGVEGLESGTLLREREKPRRAFRPRRVFADPSWERPRDESAIVAVVPFEHLGLPEETGMTLAELFTTHLTGRPGLAVIEPGQARSVLLRRRVIQESGLSLAQADVLRVDLDADLAVTGEVLAWEDRGRGGVARVKFAVRVIDTRRRAVVWSCLSTNRADDGPTWFETRIPPSARALASAMVRAAAFDFARWTNESPPAESTAREAPSPED